MSRTHDLLLGRMLQTSTVGLVVARDGGSHDQWTTNQGWTGINHHQNHHHGGQSARQPPGGARNDAIVAAVNVACATALLAFE